MDLAAVEGQAVLAASAGVITHAGVIAGRPTVTVLHRGGIRTTYEPVLGSPRVGSRVAAGQRIGTLALTGSHCGAAACLHLGALRGSSYLDPLVLLRGGPVILLPLG
ncbi:MAG TPA: M23 family metallopeptidase [Pedococcus sp.]|nr:M23 family metallopeptidase [Pedococcus sp.]